MKGFVEIPTRPANSAPTSSYSTTLIAVDSIATASALGADATLIVLKTLGSYPTGIVSDKLIAGMTYRFLIEELQKAAV